MEARNITFSLPPDLIRKAKVYAAEHDTTVNSFVRELLQEALEREDRFADAAIRIVEIARRGPTSTVDPRTIRREDLHERR